MGKKYKQQTVKPDVKRSEYIRMPRAVTVDSFRERLQDRNQFASPKVMLNRAFAQYMIDVIVRNPAGWEKNKKLSGPGVVRYDSRWFVAPGGWIADEINREFCRADISYDHIARTTREGQTKLRIVGFDVGRLRSVLHEYD